HRAVGFRRRALETASPAAADVGVRRTVARKVGRIREERAPRGAAASSFTREVGDAVDVAKARRQIEFLARYYLQIGAPAELALCVRGIRTLIADESCGCIIAQHSRTTAHVGGVVADLSVAPDRCSSRVLRRDDVHRLDLAGRIHPVVRRRTTESVLEPVDASSRGEAVPRTVGGAFLGDDVDDTVGRLRAVEGRRSGTLEDLDALDLIRVEIVEPRHDARAEGLD